jgi:VanZ family protein
VSAPILETNLPSDQPATTPLPAESVDPLALVMRPRARYLGGTRLIVVLLILSLNALALYAFSTGPVLVDPAALLAWDKLGHFALFFAATAAVGGLILRWFSLGISALLLILIGLTLEIAQAYIPGRTADFADFLMDQAGIVAALLLFRALRQIRHRRQMRSI